MRQSSIKLDEMPVEEAVYLSNASPSFNLSFLPSFDLDIQVRPREREVLS